MFNSIRTKLTATYIILIVAVMAFAAFFLLNVLSNYYLSYEYAKLQGAAKVVRDLVATKLQAAPDVVDISNQAELVARQNNARILITDHKQRVLGDSVRVDGLVGTTLDRMEIARALMRFEDEAWSIQYSDLSDTWVMQVAVPVLNGDKVVGAVFIASSLAEVYEVQKDLRNYIIILMLLTIMLAGLLGHFLARRITDPIESLTVAAEKMAAGDLSQHVSVRSQDEIGRLTKQFNEMAMRLQESTRQLKDFVANASHEMRTPLTSLNLLVKSLREYPLDKEEQEEFLADIDQELERLIHLVEELLDLSRLDRLAAEDTMMTVDVVPLLRDTLDALQRRAEDKNIALTYNLADKAKAFVVPHQIKQVVFNLIDNAIKYTPEGGQISVNLTQEPNLLKLTVSDTGIGIPVEQREKVFERFYRIDKARSREQGGTGLGLSIVLEIVKRHQGKVWIEDGPGGQGTTFVVTLPRLTLPTGRVVNNH
ncbi:MAG: cell wall metabolism sensor histidine kinase WalK [Firmicutes bacterium]|nr:cell wall metabolism sensor histidine kinase WalK [Bacillota bacterium]